jgi:hypothetical protein
VEATTSNLLQRFIKTFEAAIDGEMRSMQERLGPFEIPLAAPRRAGDPDAADGELYAFDMPSTSRAGDRADERLVPGLECTLRHDGGEIPVTVITVGGGEVVVASQREIRLDRVYTLVVYPWFLYERLKETLASLPDSSGHFTESALRLFGKIPPRRRERPPAADHRGLNDSQLAAVRLASESDLSFIWGPPGTGKTHTLGHVVAELIRHGERVLITSTTNAAVDRALAKLASIGETAGLLERGLMIRIGSAPTKPTAPICARRRSDRTSISTRAPTGCACESRSSAPSSTGPAGSPPWWRRPLRRSSSTSSARPRRRCRTPRSSGRSSEAVAPRGWRRCRPRS